MSATVSANPSPFNLGEPRCGNPERTVLWDSRTSEDSREPFVLTVGEFAYSIDTVPNVKRKGETLHSRFGTQLFVLQGHG